MVMDAFEMQTKVVCATVEGGLVLGSQFFIRLEMYHLTFV